MVATKARYLPLFVLLPLMLCAAIYSARPVSASAPEESTLSVTGNAVVYEQPDTVKVILGTSVLDPDVKKATERAAINVNRALSALRDMGIPESSIQTLSYTISAEYRYVNNEQVLVGYRVVHTIQVTYSGPDLGRMAGRIIDACVSCGFNNVNGVYFAVSDAKLSGLRTAALEAAVKDAKEKAEAVARMLGVNIVGVKSASESYTPPVPIYKALETSTTIMPGAVSASASISITFYIS